MSRNEVAPASSLSSYTTLPITLPPVPAFPKPATHYLYLRKDTPKNPTDDTPRSVFVSNIPIDASEDALRTLFKQVGDGGARVDKVVFEDDEGYKSKGLVVKGQKWEDDEEKVPQTGKKRKRNELTAEAISEEYSLPSIWSTKIRKSGGAAVVLFVDKATAEMALKECKKLSRKGIKLEWKQTERLGVERYKTHHKLRYPERDSLQHTINSYLVLYTAMEETRSRKLKQLRSEPDEDGFVTVVRGGRVGPARVEEAQAAQERHKEREKKRVGSAFYRFQTREQAKLRERELRDKFEDDARRIREMRERKGAIRPEE